MENMFTSGQIPDIELGDIYFWTATINKWQKLMNKDE
jgi:hypothetical protein